MVVSGLVSCYTLSGSDLKPFPNLRRLDSQFFLRGCPTGPNRCTVPASPAPRDRAQDSKCPGRDASVHRLQPFPQPDTYCAVQLVPVCILSHWEHSIFTASFPCTCPPYTPSPVVFCGWPEIPTSPALQPGTVTLGQRLHGETSPMPHLVPGALESGCLARQYLAEVQSGTGTGMLSRVSPEANGSTFPKV